MILWVTALVSRSADWVECTDCFSCLVTLFSNVVVYVFGEVRSAGTGSVTPRVRARASLRYYRGRHLVSRRVREPRWVNAHRLSLYVSAQWPCAVGGCARVHRSRDSLLLSRRHSVTRCLHSLRSICGLATLHLSGKCALYASHSNECKNLVVRARPEQVLSH